MPTKPLKPASNPCLQRQLVYLLHQCLLLQSWFQKPRTAIMVPQQRTLSEGCHLAVDCPQGGWLWNEPEWISFETRANLKRVALHEQSSGKSLCISTTSLRTLQLFGQHQFSESDPQSVSREGSVCSVSDYSTQAAQLIVEAFFPEHFYRRIPSLLSSNALVTRNLAKSEWLKDARGLELYRLKA